MAAKEQNVKAKTGLELKAQYANRQVSAVPTRAEQLQGYKEVVVKRQRNFVDIGTALGLIRKEALFEEDGYTSFEEFVEREFDMTRSYAYRLVDAARVISILSPMATLEEPGSKIKNEAQARQLVPLGKDRNAMLAVLAAAERRGGPLTAAALEAARNDLYPAQKTIDGDIVRPPLATAVRAAIEGAAELAEGDQETAAAASPTADGGATLTEPPATGPGPTTPSGEADRPGPVVTPTNLTDEESGPVVPVVSSSAPSDVPGVAPSDGAQAGPESPDSEPAGRLQDLAGVSGPAATADPEEPNALTGDADPVQDEAVGPRPAPDPRDPAALLDWLAERWEQVDADVSGPLLTDDDVQLLEAGLNRIVFTFELLIKWRDRAQP